MHVIFTEALGGIPGYVSIANNKIRKIANEVGGVIFTLGIRFIHRRFQRFRNVFDVIKFLSVHLC